MFLEMCLAGKAICIAFLPFLESICLRGFLADKQVDGFEGPSGLVSVAQARQFGVVVAEPFVEIACERFHA